jgi:hypothetical protein
MSRTQATSVESSGGGTSDTIVVTGTIDDSNVTFIIPTVPNLLIINGLAYRGTGGAITWTYDVGGVITLSAPVGDGGTIFGVKSCTIFDFTGDIDDVNTDFTEPALIEPSYLIINGAAYVKLGGWITWTYSAGDISISSAVGDNGCIFGVTGVNFIFNLVLNNSLIIGTL